LTSLTISRSAADSQQDFNQHTVQQPGHRLSHAHFPEFMMVVWFIGPLSCLSNITFPLDYQISLIGK